MDGTPIITTDPDSGDVILEEVSKPQMGRVSLAEVPHFENLALHMAQDVLDEVAQKLTEQVTYDDDARTVRLKQQSRNYDLLGYGPESEPDNIDYEAADTSGHPLLAQALTRFQAKALSALLPSDEKAVVAVPRQDFDAIPDPQMREQARREANASAKRVEKFYTEYLFVKHPSYVDDTDSILNNSGLNGVGLRKIGLDMTRINRKVTIERVPPQNLLLSYDAETYSDGRLTHIRFMQSQDLIKAIRSEVYRDVEINAFTSEQPDDPVTRAQDKIAGITQQLGQEGDVHKVYDIYCWLFLAGDEHPQGHARPYIVSIHAASMEVMQVRRNWAPNDEDEDIIESFAAYVFLPGKSPSQSLGLGDLLSNITKACRSAQRAMLESAYLANHASGFKLGNLKIQNDSQKLIPGEFMDVQAPVEDIRSVIMPWPFKGADQSLLSLMEKMESNGKELGGAATIDMTELMKPSVSPGPALAAYDESTEFQSSVHRRLYRSHKHELDIIHTNMRYAYGNKAIPFGMNSVLQPQDLMLVDIRPVMKPGQASKQRAMMEAMSTLELADRYPDMINKRQALEDFLYAAGRVDLDTIMLPDPGENPPQPADAVTEYAMAMRSEPIAVGPHQNHMAHIAAHSAQMAGLQNSQLPVEAGEQVMAMLAAHIAEHYAIDMQVKVAAAMGIPLDQMQQMAQQPLPPEMEQQMAQAIAKVEADRAPPEEGQGDSRVAVEQVKGQVQMSLADLEHQQTIELEKLKADHARQLQEQKDAAEMERAKQDDEVALEIANMKAEGTAFDASSRAGVISR